MTEQWSDTHAIYQQIHGLAEANICRLQERAEFAELALSVKEQS